MFQLAGIFAEVFGRTKLLGIDEKRDDNRRAFTLRRAYKRKMPFVQRAHGRHEAENAFSRVGFVRNLLHPFDGVDGFHGRRGTRTLKRNTNEISAHSRRLSASCFGGRLRGAFAIERNQIGADGFRS